MRTTVTPQFVKTVPNMLQEGVLYVSVEYATVVHKCLCGCGKEVVTPLSPTDWCLTFDGDSVSLDPSVGNWSFPCKSHYWIRNNQVLRCGDMPQHLIDAGRARDKRDKAAYYTARSVPTIKAPSVVDKTEPTPIEAELRGGPRGGPMSRLASWLTGAK